MTTSVSDCKDLNDTFLQLPKATQVILVESQDDLLTSSSLVESARVCGIDAEWVPGLPTATATLLQLAFTTASPHQPGSFVLLLDLLSLPQSAVKDFLQGLLRNAKVLKVGYGLVHDLWAIAAALGDEGLGCVAVVEPQLDVGTLHRQLHKAHVPGIAKVVGKGLSALTQAQLSMPLDKSLQCSTWGLRPLTQTQVEYAALDALCLLMLLDNMIACAPPQQSTQNAPSLAETNTAQPSESDDQQTSVDAVSPSMSRHKLSSHDGAASGQPAAPSQQQVDGHNVSETPQDALQTASMSNSCAEAHLGTADTRDSTSHKAPDASNKSLGSITEEAAAADSSGSASGPSADQTGDQRSAGLQTYHEAAIQQAVEHWACRLEMTPAGKAARPKAKRHLSRRQRAHIRHAVEQQNQIDDVAGAPVYVPWKDHPGEPRFICDVMTEGLAKQLRLYGVDAAAVQTKGKGSRHLVYRQMVDVAQAEERVILTCDRTFIRMGYSDQAFYVRTTNKQEQVKEVLAHFDITINEDSLLSRCAKCNGTFYPRPIPAGELPSNASEVAHHIKELHREFWVCKKCGQVYWQGTQYGNALQQLSQRLSGLAVS
ncbi:hypothetical protein WJX82_011031 [Trebouxia sp. C0006]